MGRWELAYAAARIGVGIWFLLRFLPMSRLLLLTEWGTVDWSPSVFGALLQLVPGLLAGIGLLLGYMTRVAAFIATILCLVVANAGMAAICIGLIGFYGYNCFSIDDTDDETP